MPKSACVRKQVHLFFSKVKFVSNLILAFGLVPLQYSESRLVPQSQNKAMASRKVLKPHLVQTTEYQVNKDCKEHEELLN